MHILGALKLPGARRAEISLEVDLDGAPPRVLAGYVGRSARRKVARTRGHDDDHVNFDYDEKGKVIGIELLADGPMHTFPEALEAAQSEHDPFVLPGFAILTTFWARVAAILDAHLAAAKAAEAAVPASARKALRHVLDERMSAQIRAAISG
jgi:uncharacterized protein YuzE